jgi:hypothetical protein
VEIIGNAPEAITGNGLMAFTVTVVVSETKSGVEMVTLNEFVETIGNTPPGMTNSGFGAETLRVVVE